MFTKQVILICLVLSLLEFACTQKASDNKANTAHSTKIQNPKPTIPAKEIVSVTGKFESKKGVMTELSCFCYNCGYLITEGGKRVAICFPNDNEEINCSALSITGEYVTESKEPEHNGVCGGGTITYLKVSSFECLGK